MLPIRPSEAARYKWTTRRIEAVTKKRYPQYVAELQEVDEEEVHERARPSKLEGAVA